MDGKIIAVYSRAKGHGRTEYAINLSAALGKVTKSRALLIDMAGSVRYEIKPNTGVDFLKIDQIDDWRFERVRKDYQHIVINLPFDFTESIYETCAYFEAIHFFVDSTKDDLDSACRFMKGLLEKDMEDIHAKIKVVVNRLNIFDKFSAEEISWLLRRNAWAIIPEPNILEPLVDLESMPIVLKSPDSMYSKTVLYIAKRESGKLLGLALGSGAAFGLAHIGVLRIIEQERVSIDVMSGSSIGALIASMWGLGFSSDKIEHIAKKLRSKLNIMRLLDFSIPISSILTGNRLKRFLKNILGEKTFEDLKIPVKIMVYDLANRETLAVENGLLLDAVYKSISIPGIFKPVMEQGKVIVDGGISDPVPVDVLLSGGAKKIIAVNVMPGPKDICRRNMRVKEWLEKEKENLRNSAFYTKAGFQIRNFLRKIFTPNIFDVIMTSMQSMEYMLAENSCRKASIVLRPVLIDATSIDFHLVKDFIKKGEEEAVERIEELKRLAEQ